MNCHLAGIRIMGTAEQIPFLFPAYDFCGLYLFSIDIGFQNHNLIFDSSAFDNLELAAWEFIVLVKVLPPNEKTLLSGNWKR